MPAVLTGLAACASPASPSSGAGDGAPPPAATPAAAEEYLLAALGRAVQAHEDEVARRLLDRLRAQPTSARADELAAAYERILTGRELVRALELRLAVAPAGPGLDAPRRVVLVAGSGLGRPLTLRTGPATLEVERRLVDPLGRERVERQTSSFDTASLLELPARGTVEVELVTTEAIFPPGALAERRRWRLLLRAGEVEDAGARFPAMHARVAPAEEELVVATLDAGSVDPRLFASEAATGRLGARAALELAVQVSPARREEALDAAAPVVEDLPLAAVAELTPALRWLAPGADAGSDPAAWRAWLRARAAGLGRRSDAGRDDLDDLDDRLDLPR